MFSVGLVAKSLKDFGINQHVIDRLQGLDLTNRIQFDEKTRGIGTYSDVFQGQLLSSEPLDRKIAIKRMRFYLCPDMKEVNVPDVRTDR